MALTINDTTYAGTVASSFAVSAITGADTVDGGHVMLMDDVRKTFTIPTMEVAEDIIQPRSATPTGGGTSTIGSATLTPQDFMVYLEFNPRDLEQHWQAAQLSTTLLDRQLPPTVESFVVMRTLQRLKNVIEKQIWQGNSTLNDGSSLSYYDGLIRRLSTSADTIIPSGVAALTAGNIIASMESVYQALPSALIYNPDVKFFVSYKTMQLYRTAQVAQTYKGIDPTVAGVPQYAGKKVVALAGVPNNTIVAAIGKTDFDSNLWVGYNSMSDENNIQLARLQANSEMYFLKMLLKMDTQVVFPSQAVLWTV